MQLPDIIIPYAAPPDVHPYGWPIYHYVDLQPYKDTDTPGISISERAWAAAEVVCNMLRIYSAGVSMDLDMAAPTASSLLQFDAGLCELIATSAQNGTAEEVAAQGLRLVGYARQQAEADASYAGIEQAEMLAILYRLSQT